MWRSGNAGVRCPERENGKREYEVGLLVKAAALAGKRVVSVGRRLGWVRPVALLTA